MRAVSRRIDRAPLAALLVANLAVVALACFRPDFVLFLVVAAVAVPALGQILRRPQLGVLVLVALAPFNGVLLIVPHASLLNGWKEALVVWTLLATFLCPPAARSGPAQRRPTWLLAFIGMFAIALFAAALDLQPVRAALGLKITFFYVLIAWVLVRCPLEDDERDRLVSILMVTGVVTAVIGILQQVVGPARLNALGFEYNSTIRFSGAFFRSFSTFIQPFGFGFYVMAVILICTPVALANRDRRRNQLFLLCLPILGLGMATSVVRGAFLGLVVGLAYLGASRYRILLLAFPLAIVSLLVVPRDVTSAALSATSTAERATGWRQNLKVLTTHPLGAGPGNSAAAAERLAKDSSSNVPYQPDNEFYHLAYDNGILALWCFCLLLVAGFTAMRRQRTTHDGEAGAFYLGASAFILAAAAASLVASFFEIFPMDVWLWVLLGLAAFPAGGTGRALPAPRNVSVPGYAPS